MDELARMDTLGELLLVQASEVTVRWLRFTGVDPRRNLATQVAAVQVGQGRIAQAFPPKWIANVQIVDDMFDNSGFDFPYIGGGRGEYRVARGWADVRGRESRTSAVSRSRGTRSGTSTPTPVACRRTAAATRGTASSSRTTPSRGTRYRSSWALQASVADRDADHWQHDHPEQHGTTTVTGTGGSGISIDSNATNGTIDHTLIEDNTISGPATLLLIQAAATVPPGQRCRRCDLEHTDRQQRDQPHRSGGAGGIGLIGGDSTASPPEPHIRRHDRERHHRQRPETRSFSARSRTDPARAATRSPTSSSATRSSTSRPAYPSCEPGVAGGGVNQPRTCSRTR